MQQDCTSEVPFLLKANSLGGPVPESDKLQIHPKATK